MKFRIAAMTGIAALAISAGAATSNPFLPGTTYWYFDEGHTQLSAYSYRGCDGVVDGPYGPGGAAPVKTEHRVFIPENC